jgi:hypothetical protein
MPAKTVGRSPSALRRVALLDKQTITSVWDMIAIVLGQTGTWADGIIEFRIEPIILHF